MSSQDTGAWRNAARAHARAAIAFDDAAGEGSSAASTDAFREG